MIEETLQDQIDREPRLLLHGLDSLYICYNVDLFTSKIDFDELEHRKQFARDRDDKQAIIELGGEKFLVRAFGQYPYRYQLINRDFSFALAEHMHPSLKVQFFSEALWRDGAQGLHDRVLAWARELGAVQLKLETVSRADWAFDFNLPIVDFDEDHFSSKARKNSKWRDSKKVQTFSIGAGDTLLRVYDKIAEIENASGKSWFFDLWQQSQNVWRIEFQVRGERLKAGGIKSFADLEDLQGDLLRELATTHTTLRLPSNDVNRSRWPLHPLWQSLNAGIESIPNFGLCRHYDSRNPLTYRKRKQAQMLYGYLKGLGAVMTLLSSTQQTLELEEVLERLPHTLRQFHSTTLWKEDIEKRIQDYETGQW